jgi:hypothetical protein
MRVVFVSDHFSAPAEPGILRTSQVANYLAAQGDDVVVIASRSHYLFSGRAKPAAAARADQHGGEVRWLG